MKYLNIEEGKSYVAKSTTTESLVEIKIKKILKESIKIEEWPTHAFIGGSWVSKTGFPHLYKIIEEIP